MGSQVRQTGGIFQTNESAEAEGASEILLNAIAARAFKESINSITHY